jgi:hypothetical protein
MRLTVPFQIKYTGIPALIRAFDRAIAQCTWPRVWPRDPFGDGSCTSGYILKWVANLSWTESRRPNYVPQLIRRTWRFDTCTFLPCWGSTRLSVQDIPAEHPHSWNG